MTAPLQVLPEAATRVELGLVRAENPKALVAQATEVATALGGVIEKGKLFSNIQGKKFVKCEGWTTLAAMLGVTPREISVTEQDGIYTATVALCRLSDGAEVGRASAECGAPDEFDRNRKPLWSSRPRYARRSMALTRATAKACRLSFSWVMAMSGFEVTPAEEIPQDDHDRDTGEILDPVTAETRDGVFQECVRAGVGKEDFEAFYKQATGRPWVRMYEQDIPLLRRALTDHKSSRGTAASAAAAG